MQLTNPFSLPTDGVRWACVGIGLLLLWRGARELDHRQPPRWLMVLAPLAAAALSAGYIVYYLRGGPRIIDATAYYLQARTFAAGMLTLPLSDPESAVMGRFLVRAATEHASAAVIFPPGYPAVLATGFLAGFPLAIGPLIAAMLVVATMLLAQEVAHLVKHPRPGIMVGYAALASVFCAALRYHTADTMSHGLAALCMTSAVAAWLRCNPENALANLGTAGEREPQRHSRKLPALVLGLAAGLLFATRPASAIALAAVLGAAQLTGAPWRVSGRSMLAIAAGAAGPLALWFAYQRAATGSWLSTAQSLYYATSDGPGDCFRYAFGSGIGCQGEHGAFVEANLSHGYGWLAAAKTSGRRLMMHVSDAMGFAPAFAAVIAGAVVAWHKRATRSLVLLVLAQWLAYAPFYFDGNYPGAGARMFADILPLQHVLAALGLGAWQFRGRRPSASLSAAVLLAAAHFGFAFHLGAHHEQLRDREGGRPMFTSSLVPERDAMLFVDTDHGFNLAYDPLAPTRVARLHDDGSDTIAWVRAGRPRAYRYAFSFAGRPARLQPIDLHELSHRTHIEGESLWPAAAQSKSWAFPRHVASPCVSGGRVLAIRANETGGEVRLSLPAALAGRAVRLTFAPSRASSVVNSVIYSRGRPVTTSATLVAMGTTCVHSDPMFIPAGATELRLTIHAHGSIGLDVVDVLEKR